MALVEGEYGLTVGTEEHKVGFPMAWGSTILGRVRTFCEGASKADERSGTGGFRLPVAPFGLGPGEVVSPGVVLLASDLRVDESVDGFVGDDVVSGLAGKPAGNLLGRPALGEAREDALAQAGVTIQARPRPTTGPGLLMGIRGQVVTGARLISLQLSSN